MDSNDPLDVRKLAAAVMTASSAPTDLAVLRALAVSAAQAGPIQRLALLLMDGKAVRRYGPVESQGNDDSQEHGTWLMDGEHHIDRCELPARPMCMVASMEHALGRALRSIDFESCTLIPILDARGVLGALVLGHAAGHAPFKSVEDSVNELTNLGAHMGTAISLQRMAAGEGSDTRNTIALEQPWLEGRGWDAAALQAVATTGRLASLGTLAGGVIHEINNPVAFIALAGGQIEKLANKAKQNDECEGIESVIELAQGIRESMDQIRDMVTSFRLLIGVANHSVVVTVDLARVLKAAVELTRAAHRHDAAMETDFEPMPPCPGHYVEVGPVVVNVLVNAIESLRSSSGPNLVRVEGRVRDDIIQVRVRDSGDGIPAHLLPRIFEPFFTTRDRSQHAGLGLTITQETLRTLDGQIEVESEVGKGTTVQINVPVRQPTSQEV